MITFTSNKKALGKPSAAQSRRKKMQRARDKLRKKETKLCSYQQPCVEHD